MTSVDRRDDEVRILWGRVAALGAGLLVAFLLGLWVGGGDGADPDELVELRERNQELLDRNEQLEEQVDALSAGEDPAAADPDEDAEEPEEADGGPDDADGDPDDADGGPDAGDGEADAQREDGQTYTVQQGDTLTAISQQVYGSSDHAGRIAEANGLEADASLVVGMELWIPPLDED